jgi:nucleoside-diphosphate-sugar epimerase
MRVLVSGGTGFLGRAIVRSLVARRHEPVVFARAARRAGLPGLAIDGDVRDASAFSRAAEGCDAIVHAAALVSIWQVPRDVFDEVNVGGLRNAVAAGRHAGIGRIVYTSSFLAAPPAGRSDPLAANDYQRTKVEALATARRAREAGCPIVILLPGVLYGPGAAGEANLVGRLIADHLAGHLPGIVGGNRIWSFSYVEDVAEAHVAALEAGDAAGEYGVGGENLPQRALFEWLRLRTGRPLPREIPCAAAWIAGWLEEARVRLTRGALPRVTRGAVEIFRHDWPVDSQAAIRHLHYAIRPLADGLERTCSPVAPGATTRSA